MERSQVLCMYFNLANFYNILCTIEDNYYYSLFITHWSLFQHFLFVSKDISNCLIVWLHSESAFVFLYSVTCQLLLHDPELNLHLILTSLLCNSQLEHSLLLTTIPSVFLKEMASPIFSLQLPCQINLSVCRRRYTFSSNLFLLQLLILV